jgi:hypothetical protein
MEGAPLGPLFALPPSPHYLWIVGLAFAAVAIVVAGSGLVWGRLPFGWGVPGLVLVSGFAYVIGALVVLEESKRVAFCGSCHETMSPLVASLDEDNGSLASKHWRIGAVSHVDACFQCHGGYGIWGTADAKLAGVEHMLHTVTGRYSFPLVARKFDIASCLGCHAEAAPFRAQEAHHDAELQQALLSGSLGCVGTCHAEAHPAKALVGARAEATGAR